MSSAISSDGRDNAPAAPAAGRGRPRDPAKDQAIVEAAACLFLERGFDAAGMDAIAAEARVSKATLYARYPDKDALFREVIRHKCESAVDPAAFAFDASRSPRQILIDIAHRFIGLVTSPEAVAMHRLICAECGRAPRVAELFFDVAVLRMKARFVGWVEAENAAGRLACRDPDGAAWRFLGAVKGEAHMRASFGLPPVEPERLAAYVEACADDWLKANGG
jgi:TetR/AcrR family transcriptional repressor of mexJK operon